MIARTHGQIATPTTIGKEFANFAYRLENLLKELKTVKFFGKINGAVGNFNAHVVAYPKINWLKVSENFITSLNLSWNKYTTQIEPHDFIATFSNTISHINTVLIDLARDMWGYIAFNYFQQEANKKEVGSSTMPHKINPIDFENAEGNLGIANVLLNFFASKLPISRMQRDLSDSTVLRNLGVAFAHTYLAYQSLEAGLKKITTNKNVIAQDLHAHYEVLAEAIQTVMRKYKIAAPYEKLKSFTRGKIIDKNLLHKFIATLSLPENEKINLKNLTPEKYTGLAIKLAKEI